MFYFLVVNKLNAINSAASLETSIKKAKILPISKIYSRIKGLLTRKNKLVELVRRSILLPAEGNFSFL